MVDSTPMQRLSERLGVNTLPINGLTVIKDHGIGEVVQGLLGSGLNVLFFRHDRNHSHPFPDGYAYIQLDGQLIGVQEPNHVNPTAYPGDLPKKPASYKD